MKISYAVEVCTEHRELEALLHFLTKVKDSEDEINVLVDSSKFSNEVSNVLDRYHTSEVTVCQRMFDNNFSAHRNYHITQCKGDYIFMIDADEMPQETLINSIKDVITKSTAELIFVPRMNLCPGYTDAWARGHKFNVNEVGWINWPDYQGRIFKNSPTIKWGNQLHEKVEGASKSIGLEASPKNGLWHIKTVLKQDAQGKFYDSLPPSKR